MRKWLVFYKHLPNQEDEIISRYELTPITYEEFLLSPLYREGCSDIEYNNFLQEHNYHELDEFNLKDLEKDQEYFIAIH